jgi:hypothetical protein
MMSQSMFKRPNRPFLYTLVLVGLVILARLNFHWPELFILAGALAGAYLWEYEPEIERYLNHSSDKPILRNVFTQAALAAAALFAVSSSSSLLAAGFAFSLFLRSLVEQVMRWRAGEGLAEWFWPVREDVRGGRGVEGAYLTVMVILAGFLSLLLVV